MTKEERAELLRMAIIEAGSIREGLKLFREITAELDNVEVVADNKDFSAAVEQDAQHFHGITPKRPSKIPSKIIINAPGARSMKRWTPEELNVCKSMAKNHASFAEIGKAVGRSPHAIYHAWYSEMFDHPDKVRDNTKKREKRM